MINQIIKGDCLEVMKNLPDNSVDSIVTDPPYGLSQHKQQDIIQALSAWLVEEEYLHKKSGFMGKTWDSFVPGPEVWKECLRVLKPGGHALVFAGARTQDLMAISLRLAGFELRDCIMWCYGSGFPKSHNISKAIDKMAGAEREVVVETNKLQSYGHSGNNCYGADIDRGGVMYITAPATPEAQQWEGWGTALKPAYEPILLVRKPISESNIAANVLEWGTGGINVDGARVELDGTENLDAVQKGRIYGDGIKFGIANQKNTTPTYKSQGRFPANLIHDGSDDVVGCFPESDSRPAKYALNGKGVGHNGNKGSVLTGFGGSAAVGYNDAGGSAARFFKVCSDDDPEDAEIRRLVYQSKASKKDRDEGLEGFEKKAAGGMQGRNNGSMGSITMSRNIHPTVKPTDLLRYLCRLITPPDGVILDPFLGSGSTGKAAMLDGFNIIGIEQDEDYVEIARARIEWASNQAKANLDKS